MNAYLVTIGRNGLQGDGGEGPPTRMCVCGADAVDARLGRDWQIRSSRRRAHEDDSDRRRGRRGPVRFIAAGVRNPTATTMEMPRQSMGVDLRENAIVGNGPANHGPILTGTSARRAGPPVCLLLRRNAAGADVSAGTRVTRARVRAVHRPPAEAFAPGPGGIDRPPRVTLEREASAEVSAGARVDAGRAYTELRLTDHARRHGCGLTFALRASRHSQSADRSSRPGANGCHRCGRGSTSNVRSGSQRPPRIA